MTMPVQPANTGNNGGGFGWGGDGAWFLIILFLFAFCGWGNGGFGGFGGGFGGNGAALQGALTRADINDGFALNNLQIGINAIQQGICDATYALNNAIQSGFNGVQSLICNLGSQLAQCCCDIRAAIQDVKYEMAQSTCTITNQMSMNTRDVIDNQNSNTRAILDWLCQEKIDAKNEKIAEQAAQIQALQLQASQAAQNATLMAAMDANTAQIIRRTGNDCPIPAYVVQPPAQVTFPTNCCGQFNGGGWGNGCNQCGNC
ncbi:MAG: hypothetical protein HFI03_14310 [Lachnospiraceae bacterium]|nr:hypothetical protein [Lachnospiraceae bacterium]